MIQRIISDGKLLIEQTKVHDGSMGPVSVLLEGIKPVLLTFWHVQCTHWNLKGFED